MMNVLGFRTLTVLPTLFLGIAVSAADAAEKSKPKAKSAVSHRCLVADYSSRKVKIVSADGEIEWEYAAPSCQDVWMLPNDNVLLSYIGGAQEVTRDKKIVWEYKTSKPNEVHTCQPLPNGNVLIGECGTCRLIEVDRDGKIAKEIKVSTTTKNPHGQMRLARKTLAGTYLVALVGEKVAREFDADGKVIWEFKTPGNVYGAIRLPNGNTLMGCGDGHKLIEVDRDGKIVWSIDENELPGQPLRFVAGVQRLPNGNTVVCNWGGHGHLGKQPHFFEVTRDKKVVWSVFDNQKFRAVSGIQLLDVPGDVTKGEILR